MGSWNFLPSAQPYKQLEDSAVMIKGNLATAPAGGGPEAVFHSDFTHLGKTNSVPLAGQCVKL